ncbi:D-tyrosyl-tRNA(Tyr) deacylase [Boudabousia tangfeifanii]|uniref:D-aminoacyl-tRNA deacylase n=1 Tax=Boudabousia tangfeifanii TaxID=1912795 RepID=A0A1D9MIK8_9ACTO|nr:D-aminoacyl-tRNA deacylase [Boudabousia tangfeifanii]AOZ72135.1 D-tyrosyl-tRNA(Tyr) deacylase [Boudabousia tangfeifanii]
MRAVVQRALRGAVRVDGQTVGEITRPGLVVLVGITHDDGPAQIKKMVDKLANLRLLEAPAEPAEGQGEDGKATASTTVGQEVSALTLGAPLLLVSQFTLYGSTAKGRRPTWIDAAKGDVAEPIFNEVVSQLRDLGLEVATGKFGAMMEVELVNDGPFTVLVEV